MGWTKALDGDWQLEYEGLAGGEHLPASGTLRATVPGNVELDLVNAGLLNAELFRGDRILRLRELETVTWRYERSFDLTEEEASQDLTLTFDGVDCWATYQLNGQPLAESCNALVEHSLDVTGKTSPGANVLRVELRPTRDWACQQEHEPFWMRGEALQEEGLWVRKAPHAFGWDIMPRAVSAGIWRSVRLTAHDPLEFASVYFATIVATPDRATLAFHYTLRGRLVPTMDYAIRIEAQCGQHRWEFGRRIAFEAGGFRIPVKAPALWWPRGYGRADLYDAVVSLVSGDEVVARTTVQLGIRTVRLVRKDGDGEHAGEFRFEVNGERVFAMGTNWVPVSPFHSEEAKRIPPRLSLLAESNCNMVRCWGGNVYEPSSFYDFCDRQGVMVWQDFAMACTVYPQTPAFQAAIRDEARKVMRRLRNHPSLVLWCGDNEVDILAAARGLDPNRNVISRSVLPEILRGGDPYREYLPSSPYISPEVWLARDGRRMPEDHLWGPRDYFKSAFYTTSAAAFVSEVGFLGLPDVQTLKEMFSDGAIWPAEGREWLVHATDPTVGEEAHYWERAAKFVDRIREYFGEMPAELDDAVLASQIVQAEAFKFAIEWARQQRWRKTGILWWNLVDGWPQTSDAVVDFQLRRKLAYEYICRSQQPFVFLIGEPTGETYPLLAVNDTREPRRGEVWVTDWASGRTLLSARYDCEAGGLCRIDGVGFPSSPGVLLIRWQDDPGVSGRNHYVVGRPPMSLAWYRSALDAIR